MTSCLFTFCRVTQLLSKRIYTGKVVVRTRVLIYNALWLYTRMPSRTFYWFWRRYGVSTDLCAANAKFFDQIELSTRHIYINWLLSVLAIFSDQGGKKFSTTINSIFFRQILVSVFADLSSREKIRKVFRRW